MPVRGRYGHIEGTVRAVPSLPTIGGTGTLRGPVYLRYGLHMRKRAGPVPLPHRAPYFNAYWPHTVLPLPTGTPRYRFARTAPLPFCPRVALTSPYQPVPPRYRPRTVLPPCCPYNPLPIGAAPVPPPYRFPRTTVPLGTYLPRTFRPHAAPVPGLYIFACLMLTNHTCQCYFCVYLILTNHNCPCHFCLYFVLTNHTCQCHFLQYA